MIFPGSRYQNTGTYTMTQPDGTVVAVLQLPLPGPAVVQGYYPRRAAMPAARPDRQLLPERRHRVVATVRREQLGRAPTPWQCAT